MSRIIVIIPCYNKVQLTKNTIESLITSTLSELFIVLVDDNSTDYTAQYALEVGARLPDHFFYLKNEENIGVNAAWNKGLRTAMATEIPYICIANNDLLFTEGWDVPLIDALDNGYSLVSPYSTEMALPGDWPKGRNRHVNPVSNTMKILGACFAFKRELIDLIGYFPEVCRYYYGDNWIQDAAAENGLQVGHIKESYIHHFLCQTTRELNNSIWFKQDGAAYSNYCLMKKKLFTIGYRARFQDKFDQYLGPSLAGLAKDSYMLIAINCNTDKGCTDFESATYPADNYNEMIHKCITPFLILVHEDVTFTPDLLECIKNTIDDYPDFGAIGLVGALHTGGNAWSSQLVFEVDTLDSCLVVIRPDLPFRFNHIIFDNFHLYVEDYCAQLKQIGKKIYTIKLKENTKIDHCSTTWHQLGAAWGDYGKYKQTFEKMWPGLMTT